jgi:dihydrofolate reductase
VSTPQDIVAPPSIAMVIVVAVADNGVIGSANAMPWRLRSEHRHFRALTLGKPVVMGRKTFASIGRPLDRRTNIVVSRDPAFAAPGIVAAPDLDAALAIARADALRRGVDAIMIIGGAAIYAQAMPRADRVALSLVHLRPEGETRLPPIDPALWVEVERREHGAGPGDDSAFTFVELRRKPATSATQGHAAADRAIAREDGRERPYGMNARCNPHRAPL